jgi:hypothetical protein
MITLTVVEAAATARLHLLHLLLYLLLQSLLFTPEAAIPISLPIFEPSSDIKALSKCCALIIADL